MTVDSPRELDTHLVSIVVPVYRGERTLPAVCEELLALTKTFTTLDGHAARVSEILLVHDNGPDASAEVIRMLAHEFDVVRPVWLSRNFGQHAATLAGMASSTGDWIVTLDEDGQYDPRFIGAMLDVAIARTATVIYAKPTNKPPHGFARNAASRGAKWLVDRLVGGDAASVFHSYRLVLGEIGRSVAAHAGSGVYLDVALGWVSDDIATCRVELRDEGERQSGYTLRGLLSHFWRMILTSGTKLLRLVSVVGAVCACLGIVVAFVLIVNRLFDITAIPQGWTSVIVVVLLSTGALLLAIGVVAEYLGVAVNMAMGKPLYLIVSDPREGPLGRGAARDRQ